MKKNKFLLTLTTVAFFSILFFSTGINAGCTKDTDCKGNRICEKGICVEPGQTKSHAEGIITPEKKKSDDWLKKLDGAKFVLLVPHYPPFRTGPSGPFVAKTRVVFIIRGNNIWRQDFYLSDNGQVLQTLQEQGPYRIEGRQFAPGRKMASISEGGTFITLGDDVWQRE